MCPLQDVKQSGLETALLVNPVDDFAIGAVTADGFHAGVGRARARGSLALAHDAPCLAYFQKGRSIIAPVAD